MHRPLVESFGRLRAGVQRGLRALRLLHRSDHSVIAIDFTPLARRLDALSEGDRSGALELVDDAIQEMTTSAGHQFAVSILADPIGSASELLSFRDGFERRLRRNWEPALSLFDVIRELATEFGADINERYRPLAAEQNDFVFEALVRIHGRAALTSSEVGALLRTGHATGAMARWRTLHELEVTALFVSEHGAAVAQRYLEHQHIDSYSAAAEYQKHAEDLGHEPVGSAELDEMRATRDALLETYGKEFGERYGWASEATGNRRPTFAALERAVDLEHLRPYFRLASGGVHAGARDAYWNMGTPPSEELIQARSSHFGLADPAQNSLISFSITTMTLLSHAVSLDSDESVSEEDSLGRTVVSLAQMKALSEIVSAAARLFVDIQLDAEKVPSQTVESPQLWRSPEFD